MSQPHGRAALAKGLVLVGGATLLGNGAAYLLSMIAARVLTPAEFGALGALLGLLVIISTVGIATQALTARRVAVAGDDRPQVEGVAIRLAVVVGGTIMAAGVLVAWPLGEFFAIPVVAVASGIASIGFIVIGSAAMGIAQGREQHARLSWAFIANGAGRAVGGVVGVLLFDSVTGVGIGILVGCAAGAVIAYQIICPRTWSSTLTSGIRGEFVHVLHALFVLFTLTNVDVLLARIFLTEDESGEYSVGVLLAKIAFFLPNAIVIVLFPKMSSGDSRRAVYVATGLTAVVGLLITGFSFLFGDFVIRVLGGVQYPNLGSEAWLFALEGSAFALVQVLLYARLATQDRRAVLTVWIALGVLVTIVSLWRHDSVAQIVTTVVAVSLVLTVVGLVMDRRQAPAMGIPVETAE
ncbi:MAG: oligosaccharide flippase family protein [Actinomycetota bacterium]|nr:oligosaccharide flippase family protein [Actinomycetota bacterium]